MSCTHKSRSSHTHSAGVLELYHQIKAERTNKVKVKACETVTSLTLELIGSQVGVRRPKQEEESILVIATLKASSKARPRREYLNKKK